MSLLLNGCESELNRNESPLNIGRVKLAETISDWLSVCMYVCRKEIPYRHAIGQKRLSSTIKACREAMYNRAYIPDWTKALEIHRKTNGC
jgi:hypothetical protein